MMSDAVTKSKLDCHIDVQEVGSLTALCQYATTLAPGRGIFGGWMPGINGLESDCVGY
jgi:hypothetical protein